VICVGVILAIVSVLLLMKHPQRDGILSKLALLFNLRLEYFEKQRWQFTPHEEGRRTKGLIVAFAGGALHLAMIPQREFVKSLSDVPTDKLFLVDPLQSWFLNDPNGEWKGFEYLSEKLSELFQEYQKVLLIGNCMGASGAMLFSHLADRVLVFNPHVALHELKGLKNLGWRRLPQQWKDNHLTAFSDNLSKCRGHITVHVGTNAEDLFQIEFLPSLPNLNLVKHRWNSEDSPSLPASLKKRDMLVPLLKEAFVEMMAQ